MSSFPYKRVVVVGVTSSGKSTLAEKLAKCFGLDCIELDALYWEPNWQATPLEVFRARVEKQHSLKNGSSPGIIMLLAT
jgi:adenylate kinase family enzyme